MGLFFFFQAEDGIRDGRVTGVQTCALPIYRPGPGARAGALLHPADGHAPAGRVEQAGAMRRGRMTAPVVQRSAFAGFRFPPEVITVAVRWYLRYGLSYRDV